MKQYASYEKETKSTVVYVQHTVRTRLNENAASIKKSLSMVPNHAILQTITDEDDYGELIFEESSNIIKIV